MRIYQNCHEMYSEVKRDIHEMGVVVHPQTMQDKKVADDPAYRTLELSPCVFSILDGSDRHKWIESLGKNLSWCDHDFAERICGKPVNPGEAFKKRPEWAEFIEEDGRFAYTYAERFSTPIYSTPTGPRETALTKVLHELMERPDTRQAIVPVFNAQLDLQNIGGRHRVPCSLHYQFMRRVDGLRLMYVMRSTDFITHFPYDIWMALELQWRFASLLGVEVGPFTFFTGSLHIYAKDADEGVF